jgi:hypothetical protein
MEQSRNQIADRAAARFVNSLSNGQRVRLLLAWAAWSATVLALAAAADGLPRGARDPWAHTPIAHPVPPLARWDSGWYYWIATEGFDYDPHVREAPIGFYPLYPILVRAAVSVLHTPVFWTGIVFSLLCLLGALFFIRDLSTVWDPNGDPDETIYAILFFPTAFFFAAFYTESLFLLTTAAALWGARRGHWIFAGICAAAASLTRVNGMLILIPIALVAAAEAHWRLGRIRWKQFLALFLGGVGAAAFPAYLWNRWGSPFLYIRAKSNMVGGTRGLYSPTHLLRLLLKKAFQLLSSPGMGEQLRSWLEITSLLGFTLLAALLFRRSLFPEASYCAASVLLLWSAGSLDAIDRYVLILFPCYFLIGDTLRRHESAAFAYRFAGASLNTLFLIRFVRWLFVA